MILIDLQERTKHMQFAFGKFVLDTEKKQLTHGQSLVTLTKKNYDLLVFLLQRPGIVVSKDELIDAVWNGRVVTENTVDQCISKLRKTLSSAEPAEYIESMYGQGIKFLPQVSEYESSQFVFPVKSTVLFLVAVFTVIFLFFQQQKTLQVDAVEKPILLFLSAQEDGDEQWLEASPNTFLEQLFNYSNAAELREYKNKPAHLDKAQYLQNQWNITPELKVITTQATIENGIYTLTFTLTNIQQQKTTASFSDQNLSVAFKKGSRWINNEIKSHNQTMDVLIPDNPYVVELYMRGLAAMRRGEIDKAISSFQLCLQETPGFHLARLQLAHVFSQQGQSDEALAILSTLKQTNVLTTNLAIEMDMLRGQILEFQGQPVEARNIYLALISNYDSTHKAMLNDVRILLSTNYKLQGELDQALSTLSTLEKLNTVSEKPRLMAEIYITLSSVYKQMSRLTEAEEKAESALGLYKQMGDLIGEARTISTLGTIARERGDYKTATVRFERALTIVQSLNYKMGVGATLNELILVLIMQGELKKATGLNDEMANIAIEIDYPRMRTSALKYAFEIALKQNNWKQAEIAVKQHQIQAQTTDHQSAQFQNQIMRLELHLKQKQLEEAKILIQQLQQNLSSDKFAQHAIDFHLQRARYFLIDGEKDKGAAELHALRQQSLESENIRQHLTISYDLAEHYLSENKSHEALKILNALEKFKPFAYPHLLIKARIMSHTNRSIEALEMANKAKQQAPELWDQADQLFINNLADQLNQ